MDAICCIMNISGNKIGNPFTLLASDPPLEPLFQHCADLISTRLAPWVKEGDHESLYASYKLSLDPLPYIVENRDKHRPGILNVRERQKFNHICCFFDGFLKTR